MKIEPVCLEQVAARTGAQAVGKGFDAQVRIERVLIDSRSFSRAEHCLFVALVGRNNNGHRYIEPLYRKGVRYFLVSEVSANWEKEMPEAVFLVVPDTLKALQGWAREHRERFSFPVVGITGSNGKTWVKEWLTYLLHFDKNPVSSPKSFNSQIGVPLSVLQMGEFHDIGIFEAGISQGGEMENLQEIIRPTIGIFTNIGAAHDAGFASRDEKIREKLKFFQGTDTLIYCADYADITREITCAESLRGVRLLSFS
ncbi:MAG: bifunctional UDP-N-acetylmuramoyl-tripeptide:D-alanyl-D-alanine ligase/alanine racemase, partial [Bacteroidales bacterium]|nr:bifunctional UDP-N-acetylmuramoyl-tripeptide:D-alanyl-D-alanine ligase/alanine racemase [Bacteroidales bacterium]